MERYRVKFTGGPTSMIMHADDIAAAERVKAWRKDPANKDTEKGDDRCPPWTWKTYLYHDGKHIALPTANFMSCNMHAGKSFKLGRGSLKSATQSCLRFEEEFMPLRLSNGKLVTTKTINAIPDAAEIGEHIKAVEALGFLLDCRRAKVGMAKHVRVRPRFPSGWTCEGTILVTDPQKISGGTLQALLEYAGDMVGICDWRPGSPKSPGTHGRFTVELERI